MAKNTGKKPLSRAMSGKWQLKLFCNVRHWSRFQLGDLKCDAIKNSMDEYMTRLIHCCLKAGGWYKELTHFGVISLSRARALSVYLYISSLRTPHPLLGHAIDKKLLSTINKTLIDKISIRSFCY